MNVAIGIVITTNTSINKVGCMISLNNDADFFSLCVICPMLSFFIHFLISTSMSFKQYFSFRFFVEMQT